MMTALRERLCPAALILSCIFGQANAVGRAGPAGPGQTIGPSAINLRYASTPLAAVLARLEHDSGIVITVPAGLAADKVTRVAHANTWADALREVLQGYNYTAVAGDDGRTRRVFVTGRSGQTQPYLRHGYVSPKAARQPDLLSYQTGLAAKSVLPRKYRGFSPGSVRPIAIPIEELARQRLGDRLTLQLPGGQYDVVHDNVLHHANGDVSWVGYLDQEGKEFRAFVTTGAGGAVLGQISTPDGMYRIERANGRVWLIDMNASGLSAGSLEEDQQTADADGAAAPGTNLPGISADAQHPVTVDLMVLYTPGVNDGDPATRINNLLALTQQSFADSQIHVNLRLVHAQPVDYTEQNDNATALADLTYNRLSPDVAVLREQYGADLVVLARPFRFGSQGTNCGVTWVGGSNQMPLTSAVGFSVVADGYDGPYFCHDYTFAHELGHAFGNVHDQGISPPGVFPFSYAWSVAGQFATIMSYRLDQAPLVGKFANPAIACTPAGLPCGDAEHADNVRTINLTAPIIAEYLPVR